MQTSQLASFFYLILSTTKETSDSVYLRFNSAYLNLVLGYAIEFSSEEDRELANWIVKYL